MNSTGPSTPEGKATSSQNARKHGLFAVPKITLDNESDDQFRELFAATLQRIAPRHRHELDAVNDAAISRWRLERTWELEAALVNKALRELRAANPNPEISEAERSAVAFDKAYQESAFFANCGLYETRLRRACERAERRLDAILAARTEALEPPEIVPELKRKNELPPPNLAPEAPAKSIPVRVEPKTPRNSRCPCGSKFKYKRCCLLNPKTPVSSNEEPAVPLETTTDQDEEKAA